MGLFTIKRAKTAAYSARNVKVYIDSNDIGSVGNGQSLSVNLTPGFHSLELKLGTRSIGETSIDMAEDRDGGIVFTLSAMNGSAVFESSTSGSVSTAQSKNSGCLTFMVIIILVAIFLWIVLPHLSVGLRFTLSPG